MINNLLINFAIYDWIRIIYVIIGICCFIWTSIGNDYVFKKIERLITVADGNKLLHSLDSNNLEKRKPKH